MSMRKSIDLNSDMGESFGVYLYGSDDAILPHVTSANIACGFHAGDPATMARTVAAAARLGVAVGAHPGYPDRLGFGRRDMELSPGDVESYLIYQVGALAAFSRAEGVALHHVKPHGAMYNRAAKDRALAAAIARAVARVDNSLLVYAQPGSVLAAECEKAGLRVVHEAFADRAYNPDGSLVSRSRSGAVLSPEAAAEQALRIALEGRVLAVDGTPIPMPAETLCIHGDTPGAADVARVVRARLAEAGVSVRAP